LILLLAGLVELTVDERAELRGLLNSSDVPSTVATRARIVLWHAEKRHSLEHRPSFTARNSSAASFVLVNPFSISD
jgi:phage gp16-like protein